MVIWLIGLSGAGKSVVGRALTDRLRSMGRPAVFFDGDIMRELMGNDLGHSMDDRFRNAERICRLCKHLDAEGVDVVFAVLSIFHSSQDWNRQNYSRYFEIFLDVSMETVVRRDSKGLYRKALAGVVKQVVGVDIPFPRPKNPDLVIDNNDEDGNFAAIVERICQGLRDKKYI
ncbi:MAG: adenylyl-sulfate kinase [Candidatus Omnitrophica bacterium]|nr:adenylyl-sulfate kinase [Candidatus Omnitrophota bacterium]